jgi:site-specific DNA recombinase
MKNQTSQYPRRIGVSYNRVSTKRQEEEGDGLNSQEARNAEYARVHNIEIVARFQDKMSGKFAKRPGMESLLKWLRANRKYKPIVIVEDITRLARDLLAHHAIRSAIERAGGELRSPNIEFGTTAALQLNENMQVLVSEFHRQHLAEQTRNRRRARMLNGYWVHFAPLGYEYGDPDVGGGRVLKRKEPLATIMADGLKGLADGRFQTKGELRLYWEQFPEFPRNANGEITHEQIDRIVSRLTYAGYIESDKMEVTLRKAQHDPLIDLDAFNRMHERLKGTAYAETRKDLDQDFALRGFVSCADCGNLLTSCYATGKMGNKYAYYYCFSKGCASRSKTIRSQLLEGEFEVIAQSLVPAPEVYAAAQAFFKDAWDLRTTFQQQRRKGLETRAAEIDVETGRVLKKIIAVDSPTVIKTLEKHIDALGAEKLAITEKIEACGKPLKPYAQVLQTSERFLENPYKLWVCGGIEAKRILLKFAFSDKLPYKRGEGFQTPKKSFLFSMLEDNLEGIKNWRRERDSNPRNLAVQRFSRPPQ